MKPTFQTFPARIVMGVGGNFISVLSPQRNNFLVIPKLWHEYMQRSGEIQPRKGPEALGCVICPTDVNPSGQKGECHYLACAEVTVRPAQVPEGLEVRKIPAGRHAVFVHKGKLETLGETMNFIYASWLPNSGEKQRDAPDLEIYGAKFDMDSDVSEMEICIPIEG